MNLIQKKSQKSYPKTNSQKNHILQFGVFGFKVLQDFRLTESQVQNLEWFCKKNFKTNSVKTPVKMWVKTNLNLTLTKLSLESRMGKGKGNIYTTAQFIKKGSILFEFSNTDKQSQKILTLNLIKIFPKKIKLIQQKYTEGGETQR